METQRPVIHLNFSLKMEVFNQSGLSTFLDLKVTEADLTPWNPSKEGNTDYLDRFIPEDIPEKYILGVDNFSRAYISVKFHALGKTYALTLFQRYPEDKELIQFGDHTGGQQAIAKVLYGKSRCLNRHEALDFVKKILLHDFYVGFRLGSPPVSRLVETSKEKPCTC